MKYGKEIPIHDAENTSICFKNYDLHGRISSEGIWIYYLKFVLKIHFN